jgi:hypothetical protein
MQLKRCKNDRKTDSGKELLLWAAFLLSELYQRMSPELLLKIYRLLKL